MNHVLHKPHLRSFFVFANLLQVIVHLVEVVDQSGGLHVDAVAGPAEPLISTNDLRESHAHAVSTFEE